MNSDQIFDLIERIADAKGKEKERIIAENLKHAELVRVLKAALDPFTTYGLVREVPLDGRIKPERMFDDGTWGLLSDLAARRLTGGAALNAVNQEMERLSLRSEKLLTRIVNRDLRAGFTANTINRVAKDMIPTFSCMLAHKFEEKRIKRWPVAVEPKLDGVRVLVMGNGEELTFLSRTGKEFTSFAALKPAVRHFMDQLGGEYVLDGEAVSGGFNKTVSDVRKKDGDAEDIELHLFAVIPKDCFSADACKESYMQYRHRMLTAYARHEAIWTKPLGVRVVPSYLAHSAGEIDTIYERIRASGGEGVIVKDRFEAYQRKRSYHFLKMKAEESVECRVIGIFEGTGKYAGQMGGLEVDFNGVEVSVGGGFSDADRINMWAAPPIGRLAEVAYHETTPDLSLRHPRFVKFRDTLTGSYE
jgi:DNA ligase-1